MSAPDTAQDWAAYTGISVGVHVRSQTALGSVLYPEEDRAVLDIAGTNSVTVNLFLRRADLARLIETASAALADLDTAADDALDLDDFYADTDDDFDVDTDVDPDIDVVSVA